MKEEEDVGLFVCGAAINGCLMQPKPPDSRL